MQEAAYEAYANREFGRTVQLLSQLVDTDPRNPRWYEMRAQVWHKQPAACGTTTSSSSKKSASSDAVRSNGSSSRSSIICHNVQHV